jgi:hypothetical protein
METKTGGKKKLKVKGTFRKTKKNWRGRPKEYQDIVNKKMERKERKGTR